MSSILFRVAVTPQTSEVLQNVAFKCGYKWQSCGQKIINTNRKYLSFWTDMDITHHSSDPPDTKYSQIKTVEEAIIFLCTGNTPVKTKKFMVGEYEVIVSSDGTIKFGCTTAIKEIVEGIISARKELMQ